MWEAGNFNLIRFLAAFCSSLFMLLLLTAVEGGDGSVALSTEKNRPGAAAAASLQENSRVLMTVVLP